MARSRAGTLSEESINALLNQRKVFHRFLTATTGSAADAEDILQDSLLKALQRGDGLKQRERIVPWFYRILRNAVVDHYRSQKSQSRRANLLLSDLNALGEYIASPAETNWDTSICQCLDGLLPSLKSRYAELIRRIDLRGESKIIVRHEMKLSAASFDVALHRARNALRARLEVFCGACSRASCIACACNQASGKR